MKSLLPTRIVPNKIWQSPPIEDIQTLRPQPKRDILLIVGDATGVLDDLDAFLDFGVKFDTMAINYSVLVIPWLIQHFVAGDSHMKDMQKIAATLPDSVVKHGWNPGSVGFDVRWIRQYRSGWDGTTANLGIKVGLYFDYLRLVFAGIPIDKSGNWYKKGIPKYDIKQNKDHRHHLWKWTEIAGRPIARFIRSMSGNTADLFGRPTKEWLLFEPENQK
jgi:hypothetical protein